MNSQERAELLPTIAELSQRYPNWRLGQLLANLAGWADQEIWDIEDEQLLEAARASTRVDAGASHADWLNQTLRLIGGGEQPTAAGGMPAVHCLGRTGFERKMKGWWRLPRADDAYSSGAGPLRAPRR